MKCALRVVHRASFTHALVRPGERAGLPWYGIVGGRTHTVWTGIGRLARTSFR